MSTTALAFIIFSALMHALWNVQVKRSCDKTVFIWWMFVSSSVLFNVWLLLLPQPFPPVTPRTALLAAAGAVCFSLYHLFNGYAYTHGDLSLCYPLAQTSMIYVPIWSVLLLHEQLSVAGVCGIAGVALGAYCVQLPRFELALLLRPLYSWRQRAVQAALAAGFIYSIGSIVDKSGVNGYHPLYFTYLLVMMMLVLMSVNLCRQRYRGRIWREWQESKRLILASGPVMLGSFVAFRYGLSMAPVAYAVPARQVNVLFGVLIGVLALREPCGRVRIAAALMIVAGVALIQLGG